MQVLETKHLLLRPFNPEIQQQVMTTKSDEELMEYFGFNNNEALNTEKDRFEKGFTMFNKSFFLFYILEKQSNKVIGWCGFHTWYFVHSRAEIGYSLSADEYKGKGYMTEALAEVIAYGFNIMNLHRIEAMVGPENVPSLLLMKKFGFTKEGVLREHY
ncbi:MAG TPA: GNAT family protein, partial [Bacteroidia bacterium]